LCSGLKLAGSTSTKFILWYVSVIVQLAVLVLLWYSWGKGKKVLDVLGKGETSKQNTGYTTCEQDPFIADEELHTMQEVVGEYCGGK
jgi:hypothetical protein